MPDRLAMLINIVRQIFTKRSTIGQLSVDGVFLCYTLEPRADQSQGKPYCIPAGSYEVEPRFSPHMQAQVLAVKNVPGFTGIEIHAGNFPSDTHGCTVVGMERGVDEVITSQVALHKLLILVSRTAEGEKITATYSVADGAENA